MKKPSIVTVPNPTLLEVTKPVTSFNNELKNQIAVMTDFLRRENGVGLAANQLDYDNSVFIVEFPSDDKAEAIPLQVFINPEIVEKSEDKSSLTEGCLSVPRIEFEVERSKKIKIKAFDPSGKKLKLTAKGILAKIIQHETDHLNGIVFTERVKSELEEKFPNYKKLKILYIGSGTLAEQILKGLVLLDFNLASVITENSKDETAVSKTAKIFNLPLLKTDRIIELKSKIIKLSPDIILLSDFGQIIPQEILDIPKIFSINIHPSLLPKYRGASPIQSAILNGDAKTGITIIEMSKQIDAGNILVQEEIEIDEDDNGESLKNRLSNLALQMLIKFLPKVQMGKITKIKQNLENVTKTTKIKKEDGLIDWKKPVAQIERQIRAFFSWPGSYTFIGNKRLIIHQAILDNGKLRLLIVQPEGSRLMTFDEFLRGYRGSKETWFNKIANLEKK